MSFGSLAAVPPTPPRRPARLTAHRDIRIDDYYWMRNRVDPEVIAHLTAENEYTTAVMRDTEALQEQLFQEMRQRIRETDMTAPVADGGYWYYQRTVAGLEYPIYCRRAGDMDASEEVLLDVNALAEGHAFCKIGAFTVSPDHARLAYAYDVSGAEIFTVVVKDLRTGELLTDRIEGVYYGLEWSNDSAFLFYTTLDAAHRPDSVWRHRLGASQSTDVRLLYETDERFFVSLYKTRSKCFIVVHLHSNTTDEAHVIDTDDPGRALRVIEPRRQGHEYSIDHRGDWFFIHTNDQAEDFRVMVAPVAAPEMVNWRELLPESAGVLIDRIDLFRDHLVVLEWMGGVKQVRVARLAPEQPEIVDSHVVAFAEETYAVSVDENPTFDTTTVRLSFSSLKTPPTIYAYAMDERTLQVLKQDEIADYDPADYETRRVWATAPDGIQVPISLICRKGVELDSNHPCLLYGYGSYGANMEPSFRANRLSLIERGFVFAIAHIRGGSEMGRAWYRNGKLLNKMNTFTDFIAAAEQLIADGYTRPDRLTIMGRSAGGLLMGVVANLRPDLFAGVVAGVPFVDVVTTMMDPSIPLTVIEYEEWGNPADAHFYAYMRSYSPYDNLAATHYPPLLATAGLNDPRVSYWEPAKYVAKLRRVKIDDNVVLLKTNMAAGHGGASGRYDFLRETAFEFVFLLKTVGLA